MNEVMNMPKIETESVSRNAQRARYTAYMQCIRKLEQKSKADAESKKKAERIGGAV